MDITINNDWEWAGDEYKVAFATTSDPRIVAVIEREEEYGGGHIDGDVYAPAFYIDRFARKEAAGSTFTDSASDDIADRFIEASQRFNYRFRRPGDILARFMWIFHETQVETVDSSIDQNARVYVFNTPTWRAHVGITETQINRFTVTSVTGPGEGFIEEEIEASTAEEAKTLHMSAHHEIGRRITSASRASVIDGDVESWKAAMDGDVYGSGFAVYEERVTDEEEIDLLDGNWDITIACWGMLGEEYAKGEAFSYETPTLPALLDFMPA